MMRVQKDLEQILQILELKKQALESAYAAELRTRHALRQQQLEIVDQENNTRAKLHATRVDTAIPHDALQKRLAKLSQMQLDLQPALARSAIKRNAVKSELEAATRKCVGAEIFILNQSKPSSRDKAQDQHLMFEAWLRR